MNLRHTIFASTLTTILVLGACGGAGSNSSASGNNPTAGIGGTGAPASAKTSGSITGFGSIFVNGIEFNTATSTILIDGKAGTEADLKLGMVVNVSGDYDSAAGTGTAVTVEFNDSVQGPVADIVTNLDLTEKRLTILGVPVLVVDGSTVFDGVGFGSLAVDDLLEVSGFYDADGLLHATRVEKKTGSEVELEGHIGSVDSGAMTFTLGSYTVDYRNADLSALPGSAPAVDLSVEVRGTLAGTTITASTVRQEEDFFGTDEDKASLEGLISDLNVAGPNTFRVAGRLVDVSAASFSPASLQTALANNIKVEVEGTLVGGVLKAAIVESRQGSLAARATVQGIAGKTITLGIGNGQSVSFNVDDQTRFDDERSDAVLTLGGINPGDYLKVRMVDTGSAYLATEVTRDEPDHELLRGPVDSFDSGSVTLLGVTYTVDHDTQFQDSNDQEIKTSSAFFSMMSVGDTVKVEDERPGDGVADELEFE